MQKLGEEMLRRYTFKLYPNNAQVEALRGQAKMCAELWNGLLQMREDFFRRAKQRGDKKTSLTAFDQGKDITALRRECPEWAEMPRGTQERVAENLDLAFKAFFRRARQGAGKSSGYPRYKGTVARPKRAWTEAIPLREPVKSCWRFEPAQNLAHSGPALRGEPKGGAEASRARGEEGSHRGPAPGNSPASRARGEEGAQFLRRVRLAPASRARGDDGGDSEKIKSWRLTMRGIPGSIRARGEFPGPVDAFKTADIRLDMDQFGKQCWSFSVCVEIAAERPKGEQNLEVSFDLIDQFAVVKTADGRCAPGLSFEEFLRREGEISFNRNGFGAASCGAPENVGDAHVTGGFSACGDPAFVGGEQGRGLSADEIQSARDTSRKKFSYRWRRETVRIAALKARAARKRKDALHRWTTMIASQCASLVIISPPVKENTKTGRGTEKDHGAQVTLVAETNRRILEQAPALAISMLEYKTKARGVTAHTCAKPVTVHHEIATVAKTARKARKLERHPE